VPPAFGACPDSPVHASASSLNLPTSSIPASQAVLARLQSTGIKANRKCEPECKPGAFSWSSLLFANLDPLRHNIACQRTANIQWVPTSGSYFSDCDEKLEEDQSSVVF
jgi:hypothetical protein